MMMLSQCVTFGLMSKDFFDHWTTGESPATVSECDWREVTDMLDFQALVATFEVDNGWPNVVKTGIPLSVIISAHHNLVTYGVPFVNSDGLWTNPGPAKTFYRPEKAIKSLAKRLDLMDESRDNLCQKWLGTNPNFHKEDEKMLGMSKWVHYMMMNFFSQPRKAEQLAKWKEFHEYTREVDQSGPAEDMIRDAEHIQEVQDIPQRVNS